MKRNKDHGGRSISKKYSNQPPPPTIPDIPLATEQQCEHSPTSQSWNHQGHQNNEKRQGWGSRWHPSWGAESKSNIISNKRSNKSRKTGGEAAWLNSCKKSDLSQCGNWWGIICSHLSPVRFVSLRSHPGDNERSHRQEAKACRVPPGQILHRSHHHPAYRSGQQVVEWQSSLYITSVDFEKAFDSMDRDTIWRLIYHYGVPQKPLTIIQMHKSLVSVWHLRALKHLWLKWSTGEELIYCWQITSGTEQYRWNFYHHNNN